MAESINRQFGSGMWGQGPTRKYSLPPKSKKPEVKPEIKKPIVDKGGLGDSILSRSEFRQKLRNQALYKYGLKEKERVELEQEIFPYQKYGNSITKKKFTQAIKNLQREKTRNPKEEWKIEKKIKTLKEALGEK